MKKKQITDFDGKIIGWQVDGPSLGENGIIFDDETQADRFIKNFVLEV